MNACQRRAALAEAWEEMEPAADGGHGNGDDQQDGDQQDGDQEDGDQEDDVDGGETE